MKKILLMIMLVLFSMSTFSQEKQSESYYQDKFANVVNGVTEVILPDRTRVDIVTDVYAIEVDFAEKWAESGFQALHYAKSLDKKAGILLVWKGSEDERYLERLLGVIAENRLPITVWVWNWTDDTWSKVDYKITYLY